MAGEGSSILADALDGQVAPVPTRLHGYLRATCSRRSKGGCFLSRQGHKVPIHTSKPYWDGRSLLLNVMSPTAGMLAGDRVEIDVRVESGAALSLSNPTALRIHSMPTGEASWVQQFVVEANAFLETNPEWLIPQAGSNFTQLTRIDLAQGSELFFVEALVPGRVAHGECFAFARLRSRFELRYAENLVAREAFDIQPSKGTHRPWASAFPEPFCLSIYAASNQLDSENRCFKTIHALQSDTLLIGSTQLAHGPCWNIKAIAANPIEARHALSAIREAFFHDIGRIPSSLRR